MLLVNCIYTNILNNTIRKHTEVAKGILECAYIWIIKYITTIRLLYDIVSRAVEANIREYMPTARTNKEKIEYRKIRFLDIIEIFNNFDNAIAIARQKSSFAVFHILLRNFAEIKGGDDIFD